MPAGHDDGLSRAHPVAWRRIEGPKKLIGIDVGNVVGVPRMGPKYSPPGGALTTAQTCCARQRTCSPPQPIGLHRAHGCDAW